MVSFQPHLRSRLKEPLDAATSVAVTHRQLKEGGFRRRLEIVAAGKSKIGPSPIKFKLPEDLSCIDPDASSEVRIEEIENLAVMQSVTVHVKLMLVGVPERVQVKDRWRELTKQECVLGDATGTIQIVLWEQKIGSLQQDICYKIADAHIKVYQGSKYLSMSEKGSIQHIDDIDDVAEMESDEELAAAAVVEGVVNAVLSCEEYLCELQRSWLLRRW